MNNYPGHSGLINSFTIVTLTALSTLMLRLFFLQEKIEIVL